MDEGRRHRGSVHPGPIGGRANGGG
jgi:hypothetical protein